GGRVPCTGMGTRGGGEAIGLERGGRVPSVASIRLRLPDNQGADLPRLADEDGVTEPVHEGVKPLRVAGGLNSDRHRWPQRPVESLHGVARARGLWLDVCARSRLELTDLMTPLV